MDRFHVARPALAACLGLLTAGSAAIVCAADVSYPGGSGLTVPGGMLGPLTSTPSGAFPGGSTGTVSVDDRLYLAAPGLGTSQSGQPTRAGQWNFSIGARGALTLTDNVALAPPGQEESDLILGLSLPLGVRRQGERMKLEAEYIPTLYLYARNSESNYLQNNLRSLLTVEAIEDYFFIDASANSFPSYISPVQTRPVSGASITQNRVQQTTLGLSPYIRHQTGAGWKYLLKNDNYWNAYNDSQLSNSITSRIFAELESPPTRLNYALDYTYLYTKDQAQPVANYQQVARFRPMFRATRSLRVSARLGYETNDYVTDYSGSVYGVGLDWTPNPRAKLDGFIEHRFFGASYGLNVSYRSRRTTWRLGALRGTYTTVDQPLTLVPGTTAQVLDDALRSKIQDPLQREQAVKQFIQTAGLPTTLTQPYSFYTSQIYLAEQVSASVVALGRRNTIELTLFWQKNEPITTTGVVLPGVFAVFNELNQTGVTLNASHRLSSRSAVALSATRVYALSTNPTVSVNTSEIESTQDTVRLGLTHRLSSNTDGTVGIRWVNFNADVTPYQELALLAALAHSF